MGCGSSKDIDANATPPTAGVGAQMLDLKDSARNSPLSNVPAATADGDVVVFTNVLHSPARDGPATQLLTMPGHRASATPVARGVPPRPSQLQRAPSSTVSSSKATPRTPGSSANNRRPKRHGPDRLGALWAAEMAREMDAALVYLGQPAICTTPTAHATPRGHVVTHRN